MKKIVIIALVALGAVLSFSACNTVHGTGQDVKSVGNGIERASETR